MKTKLEMAHDYAMLHMVMDRYKDIDDLEMVQWANDYVDALESDADKRKVSGVPDAILKASNSSELKSEVIEQILHDIDNYFDSSVSNSLRDANNVIQEIYESLSGEKKAEEWQPDWSQAPAWANWWLCTSNNRNSVWINCKPFISSLTDSWNIELLKHEKAPTFDYKGDWKDSLRKRP